MSRRNGRRLDRRNHATRPALTLAQQFAALFSAGDVWFDADRVSGSNLVDYNDAAHQVILTAGVLSAPTPNAAFANANTLAYTGSQYSVSNRAPSAWRRLHSGGGSTVYFVFAPRNVVVTQAFWGTRDATLAAGANAYAAGATLSYAITNAGIVANGAGLSPLVLNTAYAYCHKFATSNTPNWQMFRGGVSEVSGANGIAPGAGDSVGTFTLGGAVGGAQLAQMDFRAFYYFGRYLTASEDLTVRAKILAETGVP